VCAEDALRDQMRYDPLALARTEIIGDADSARSGDLDELATRSCEPAARYAHDVSRAQILRGKLRVPPVTHRRVFAPKTEAPSNQVIPDFTAKNGLLRTRAGAAPSNDPVPSPLILALGQQLRALREQAHLSREEAAHRSGLGVRTLTRIETGRAGDLSVSTLEALSALYGVDLLVELRLRRLR
jgi:hypothetical protein